MKSLRTAGTLLTGTALFGLAVKRIGPGNMIRDLETICQMFLRDVARKALLFAEISTSLTLAGLTWLVWRIRSPQNSADRIEVPSAALNGAMPCKL